MARSCILLGAPRSGASLIAGAITGRNWFMGNQPVELGTQELWGFFEDHAIHQLNEAILAESLRGAWGKIPWIGKLVPVPKGHTLRWATPINPDKVHHASAEVMTQIQQATSRRPFCYKDPGFTFTLPVWSPFLKECCVLAVVRHPVSTASSMLRVFGPKSKTPVLSSSKQALQVVETHYRTLLHHLEEGREIHVIHDDHLLSGVAYPRLEELLGIRMDRTFPDRSLRKPAQELSASPALMELYRQLCDHAGFEG
ncbi:MAG: hypothetical protein SFY68_11145 [Candidatus Sumerlaeia bacterium]|nr:hypothetical protein [Candidatus Sumerlaeia bacterium]